MSKAFLSRFKHRQTIRYTVVQQFPPVVHILHGFMTEVIIRIGHIVCLHI